MDLICYTYEGWEPRIRPASPKRDWMDGSPERFAYRCLPLAIANAHGWEILSPCGFEARWNGRPGVESVEIRLDPGADPKRAPVSLFGEGTITFHVHGLIRTPEGWNLWVGGPPNAAKDGIAPLGGVIETDWSPYSFTMNWRFTRADHWVRFEENEPFCFFFPVQRGLLEGVVPQIRPIAEQPELKAAFETWSRSRDDFQAWVRETEPKAPADKWQKLYYRGVKPDGQDGPADHVAKLRLDPFRLPDGKAVKVPATACPAARPTRASTPDVAARRAQWMLDTMEGQRGLSDWHRDIQRISGVAAEDFLDEFYAQARPVVIEGAMDAWPARERWTPAYLRERIGAAPVEFQGGREGSPDFELLKDDHKKVAPFTDYLDLIEAGSANDVYITAYNSRSNAAALAPLDADIGPLPPFLTEGKGMMWIGPEGTFTPLHFDLTNNLLAQVRGRKRVILLPPSETRHLHHRRHVFSDVHDVTDEARLNLYPSARQARRYELELGPGDMLFVPVGWWHQVRALEFSVMLTFTNFIWPNDASRGYPADA